MASTLRSKSLFVTLSGSDLAYVHDIAERQYLNAVIGGNKNRHGLPRDQGKEKDVSIAALGLAGEYAFCHHFGLPWSPWLQKDADVGRAIEIRTTTYPRGQLIWRPSTDRRRYAYVLVRSPAGPAHFEIAGWCVGDRVPTIGTFGDPCRWMKGGKARESVWWVKDINLSDDWNQLLRFYYLPAEN